MITGPNNENLLFDPRFMDPQAEPYGLFWCANAEDVQAIQINAVCKALLAPWRELTEWSEFVCQYPYILVAVPPGSTRDEIASELQARFPLPVLIPGKDAFHGCASALELRENYGLSAIDQLVLDAEELPSPGLLNVGTQIDCDSEDSGKRTSSGLALLDREIGGFAPGELSVWTGRRGEGKSTLLGQILLDAINQGNRVCAYSGELPAKQFKRVIRQQAAGYLHVTKLEDPWTGKEYYTVCDDVKGPIDCWFDGNLFLTDIKDKGAHDEDTILRLFEGAHRRYGCDTFLVDNIMTAQLRGEAEQGYYRAQSAFAGRLADFYKRLGAHVHLVAHPRKTEGKRPLEADDVGGSGDITNRADNVFKVERVPEEKVQELGYSSLLTILKNREFGARGKVKLEFNEPSRRLFQKDGSPAKRYGWEMRKT